MDKLEQAENLLNKINLGDKKIKFTFYYLLIVIGLVAFFAAIFTGHSIEAWQGLLINTVYFAGIAGGALAFSVIATVTDAFWLRPIKRIAEGLSFFWFIAIILFIILFFAGGKFFEWYDHARVVHTKIGYLNIPFFVIRQMGLYILFSIIIFFYLKNSFKPDLILAKSLKVNFKGKLASLWLNNHSEQEQEQEMAYKKNKYLAPVLGFTFALTASFIAFDWMMSLDQTWFSTMFGVQFMVSSLVSAGALLIIVSGFMQTRAGLGEYQNIYRHHDIAKITFAFTLLWTYMIFSQVIVIWYANIPEETPFMILRMKSDQWGFFYWIIFFMNFIIPFFGLMSRTACRSIIISRILAIDILLGHWLEKYFIIVPSIQQNTLNAHSQGHATEGALIPGFQVSEFLIAVFIGVGVLGLFLYSFARFVRSYPTMAISDNRLIKVEH